MPENIENLVEQAHQIFGNTSVLQVIDMDRGAATAFLHEAHEPAEYKDIAKYLYILELLRIEVDTQVQATLA